jgi:hypothetical protein
LEEVKLARSLYRPPLRYHEFLATKRAIQLSIVVVWEIGPDSVSRCV